MHHGTLIRPFECPIPGLEAGANSILVGIAANQAFRTGLPVEVDRLVRR